MGHFDVDIIDTFNKNEKNQKTIFLNLEQTYKEENSCQHSDLQLAIKEASQIRLTAVCMWNTSETIDVVVDRTSNFKNKCNFAKIHPYQIMGNTILTYIPDWVYIKEDS